MEAPGEMEKKALVDGRQQPHHRGLKYAAMYFSVRREEGRGLPLSPRFTFSAVTPFTVLTVQMSLKELTEAIKQKDSSVQTLESLS